MTHMRRREVGRMKRDPIAKITFRESSPGDRGSLHTQVHAWASENGLVVAPTSVIGGGMLRSGMMPAAQFSSVAKWHNLTLKEQDECVAVATFKSGQVEIEVRAPLGVTGPVVHARLMGALGEAANDDT